MIITLFWILFFSVAGAATTVLLGDRSLLSGNMLSLSKFFHILFHWKFILAMFCAFAARYSFMVINNQLMKNPILAPNSTTLTALITSISFLFLIAGNAYFLGERINVQQGVGAALIMVGVWVVLK